MHDDERPAPSSRCNMAMRVRGTYSEDVGDEGDSAFGGSLLSPSRLVRSAEDNPDRLGSRAVPNLYLPYEGCPGPKSGSSVG